MIAQTVFNDIVYDIRLHSETGETFLCDCGCGEFRQVTDILEGAKGNEVYECRACHSWYSCVTVEIMSAASLTGEGK